MIKKDFNSLIDLVKAFPTEQSCIDHLTQLRWNGYIVSPFDPTSKVYKCKDNKYRCKTTGKYFNVRTNTIFDNTKVELIKWFMAIWLVTSQKKGISSLELSRNIDVTQKTAWFMLQRIRKCFECENDGQSNNDAETNDTIIGGKSKNRHTNMVEEPHDRSDGLIVVKGKGKMVARTIDSTTTEHISSAVIKMVKREMLHADKAIGFKQLNRIHQLFVKHNESQYANNECLLYTIEGFWSILKHSIVGIYHFTLRKHIQSYIDEVAFRYNSRNCTKIERFNLLLQNTEHRLTYKELTYG